MFCIEHGLKEVAAGGSDGVTCGGSDVYLLK
jgi:hypothetical protein